MYDVRSPSAESSQFYNFRGVQKALYLHLYRGQVILTFDIAIVRVTSYCWFLPPDLRAMARASYNKMVHFDDKSMNFSTLLFIN